MSHIAAAATPIQGRDKKLCSTEYYCLHNEGRYPLNTNCLGRQLSDPWSDGTGQAAYSEANPCR